MSVWQVCPLCGSVNTGETMLCECGFDFHRGRKAEPADPDLPEWIADWKLEPELAGPIPRRVAMRWCAIIFVVVMAGFFASLAWLIFTEGWGLKLSLGGVLLGAAFFAALVACLLSFDRERELSRLLVSRGAAMRGIIAKRTEVHVPRHGSTLYYDIAYDTPSRRSLTVTLKYQMPGGLTGKKVGDTLTVLYLTEAPEQAMPYCECAYKAVAPLKV